MSKSLEERVAKLEELRAEDNVRLQKVENQINAQLILHVQTDVAAGMKSKAVAEKHNVKATFVSIVAPRKTFAPGAQSRHIH